MAFLSRRRGHAWLAAAIVAVWFGGSHSGFAADGPHPHIAGFERFYLEDSSDSAAAGRLLLGELNCTGCHQAEGAAAAAISAKQPPILDAVTRRVKPAYIREYLRNPRAVKPGATMPHMPAAGNEAERNEQIEALVHYLASFAPEGPDQTYGGIGGRLRGEKHYHTFGCAVCHGAQGEGAETPASAKPLGNLEAKYTLPSLAEFLHDPLAVRPSGRMPSLNLSQQEARELAGYLLPNVPEKTGIAYSYYEGSWQKLPDFGQLEAKASGGTDKIDVSPKQRGDQFGLRFEGVLEIGQEGEYTFHLHSDDGSRLTIDDRVVVDHDGVHAPATKSGKTKLAKGRYRVVLDYFEQAGGEEISAEYEGP